MVKEQKHRYELSTPQYPASVTEMEAIRAIDNFQARLGFLKACYFALGFGVLALVLIFLFSSGFNTPSTPFKVPGISNSANNQEKSVAILIQATGKYRKLGLRLIESGRQHFCKTGCSNVTYMLFTDSKHENLSQDSPHKIVLVFQPRLGWPYDSMNRFKIYLSQEKLIRDFDFVMSLDADLMFANDVDLEEIYGDLVGVLHPGYYFQSTVKELPYEQREPRSTAFVNKKACSPCFYFTGAVWGGRSANFVKALRHLSWQLDHDLKVLGPSFTAVWHDESHLNRYFIDNPPTVKLKPGYYFPEGGGYESLENQTMKIVALNKAHDEMRKMD